MVAGEDINGRKHLIGTTVSQSSNNCVVSVFKVGIVTRAICKNASLKPFLFYFGRNSCRLFFFTLKVSNIMFLTHLIQYAYSDTPATLSMHVYTNNLPYSLPLSLNLFMPWTLLYTKLFSYIILLNCYNGIY